MNTTVLTQPGFVSSLTRTPLVGTQPLTVSEYISLLMSDDVSEDRAKAAELFADQRWPLSTEVAYYENDDFLPEFMGMTLTEADEYEAWLQFNKTAEGWA